MIYAAMRAAPIAHSSAKDFAEPLSNKFLFMKARDWCQPLRPRDVVSQLLNFNQSMAERARRQSFAVTKGRRDF